MDGVTISPKEKTTEDPFRRAVMAAVLADVTADVFAANTAVVLPAATVTEVGVVTNELLSDKLTSAPPVAAAPVRFTVHETVAEPLTLAGSHLKPETSTAEGTVTRPPVAEVVIGMAVGEAESALVT